MQLLISDKHGRISDHPQLVACGMKAGHFFRLGAGQMIELPETSKLFMLPLRYAIGYDRSENVFKAPTDRYLSVGAFLPPGYTATYSPAYVTDADPKPLPLFSYAAAAFHKDRVFVSAMRADRDLRHDCRFIDMARVRKNIGHFRKIFPRNRLVRHLELCAVRYGCPNAQNFFLSRYECPLPTSPSCNAGCAGCISYQKKKICRASQPRIKFVPSPEEIAQIALFHIEKVRDPIVSFGQGCEGEPLMAADTIEKALKIIRSRTSRGTINMNTNGSRPEVLSGLLDAGLDTVRVSLNSAQKIYYTRYYKPVRYSFEDVTSSIKTVKAKKKFVSVNYLTMSGFTDWEEEFRAFGKLIECHHIDMVQWRNLNFDPMLYFKILRAQPERDKLIGVREVIGLLKTRFPKLMMGYFNPSRATIARQ